jgi:arabinofuranan 3-O-arabinosyltransferase
LLTYLVPALLALLASQTWFRPGAVIANGDIGPPFAPGHDYRMHWNDFVSGEGSPSFEIIWTPFFEGLRLFQAMGLTPAVFQRVWLTALFVGAAAATVFFARGLVSSRAVASIAGVLVSFNAYRLTSAFDAIPLAALVVAGLLGGLLLRASTRQPGSRVVLFSLISVALSFVFANPPHLALVLVWLAISLLLVAVRDGRDGFRSAMLFLAKASPLVVLLNLWWIVPAFLTLTGPVFAQRFSASGVEAWAWTHARASLLNVVALNSGWGWGHPEYYPYAPALGRFPFNVLRYFLPLLAVLGVVLARGRERRVAYALAGLAAALIVVGKGLHPPLSGLNLFFYRHVPGFWLLREPTKALMLLALIFAILGAGAVVRLAQARRWQPLGAALAACLSLGAVAFAYPVYTGAVVPDKRPQLPPAHVRVPPAWRAAAGFLDSQPAEGKVLVLPRLDFYQVPTTWGYYGVSFSHLIIHRPVIEPVPGGYFSDPVSVSGMVASIETSLVQADASPVMRTLQALGVRYILLRRDIDLDFPNRSFSQPDSIAHGLALVPGIRLVRRFGLLDVYRVGGSGARDLFPAVPVSYRGPDRWIPQALLVGRDTALVRTPLARRVLPSTGPDRVFRSQRGLWHLRTRVTRDQFIVELTDPLRGRPNSGIPPFPSRQLRFARQAPPFVLTINSETYAFRTARELERDLGLARLDMIATGRLWRSRGKVSLLSPKAASPLTDCAADPSDPRSPRQLGLGATVVGPESSPSVRLSAQQHSACVWYALRPVRFGTPIRISFEYRSVGGSSPRACVWEEGPNRCARFPTLGPSHAWSRVDSLVTPEAGTVRLRLFLYADGRGEGRTVADYRRLEIGRFRLTQKRRLQVPSLVSVGNASKFAPRALARPVLQQSALDVQDASPLDDCDRSDIRTPRQAGLFVSRHVQGQPGAIRLGARAHAACLFVPVAPFEPSATYRLRFDYRSVSGKPARVCLWMDGPQRCAPLPPLRPSRGWHTFDTTVPPHAGTVGLRLFVYADGGGGRLTVCDYRKFSAAAYLSTVIIGAARKTTLPRIVFEKRSPSEFRAHVERARGPFMLVLTETYARGWRLTAAGHDTRQLVHVPVNGYANAWMLPWRGSYDLKIWYQPEVYARAALRLDVVLVPGALLLWALWTAAGSRRMSRLMPRRLGRPRAERLLDSP